MTNNDEQLFMCLFACLEKHYFVYFAWFCFVFVFGSFRREDKLDPCDSILAINLTPVNFKT